MLNFSYSYDSIEYEVDKEKKLKKYKLPQLSDESVEMINPMVPPTSGIRMPIYERSGNQFHMKSDMFFRFMRVFKAVAIVGKQEIKKPSPKVFICSDDRPSADLLLENCAKIFAKEGYSILLQDSEERNEKPYFSRMSAPYASATIALFDDIDLIVMITASHNELIWNGVKFYIQVPIPISGKVMKDVSKKALEVTEVDLLEEFPIEYIDANSKNNEYIIQLLSRITDIDVLQNTKVLFWPYLGNAPEIQDLMKKLGMKIHLIEEDVEPPNPTAVLDPDRIIGIMKEQDMTIAVMLDADRDRIVFILKDKDTGEFINLSPNELYTAMHNLLINEMNRKIINVRTIPSDPRSDDSAAITYSAGVGYKHLGMLLYLTMGIPIDEGKLNSGILYQKTTNGYKMIQSNKEIIDALKDANCIAENIIMVLWEESGGHTFNILDFKESEGRISVKSDFPLIGDKYPAPALLILIALVQKGYSLTKSVDPNVAGARTVIDAEDKKKVEIITHFSKKKGEQFTVGAENYEIGTFETIDGEVDIILMKNETTEIYFRPSGTGPNIRIYIFGKRDKIKNQLNEIKAKLEQMFP